MKSNFKDDLNKENKLFSLLDSYYQKHLKRYNFTRITDVTLQYEGVDIVLKDKKSDASYYVDEKGQLDYINQDLPTFAFELSYVKDNHQKQGWLFDKKKKTHFYFLATSIHANTKGSFASCKITIVNRKKLISFLKRRGLDQHFLESIIATNNNHDNKLILENLDPETEGYLFFSRKNKAERPINLILRLDFLCKIGVAKKLV